MYATFVSIGIIAGFCLLLYIFIRMSIYLEKEKDIKNVKKLYSEKKYHECINAIKNRENNPLHAQEIMDYFLSRDFSISEI